LGKPTDLEVLREIFKDQRQHIAVGKITQLGPAPDRSCLRVQVMILDPTAEVDREIVAVMSWDDAGPDCGVIRFPEVADLVLVAFVDGDPDQAYVLKRLTSQEEKIPLKALDGHTVIAALAGKNVYLSSDTKIFIGKPGNEGTEPVVLGNVLVSCLTDLVTQVEAIISAIETNPMVICSAPGQPGLIAPALKTALDSVKTALDTNKSNFLTTSSSNILSQLAFTERGT
jgi:hypothetical protein